MPLPEIDGSVHKSTARSVQSQTEKAQPQPQQQQHRNLRWLRLALGAIAIAFILAAAVVPTVLFVPRPTPSPGLSADDPAPPPRLPTPLPTPPPPNDPFNNSARANAHVPPLSEPFPYGKIPIRGINLGGWLVTEPFIVPSLYDQFPASAAVVDEWTLCERLGPEEARRQLEHHYATFITEDDFARMATMGFNHVRIPTGHWAIAPVKGEPFVPHVSWQYLLQAIQWARKYGLRVMVDLHTAPGSQNGWNHSGRTGQIRWLNGTDGTANAQKTLLAAQRMAQFFSDPAWKDAVPIFGVLNEPAIYHIRIDKVLDWYRLSHHAIRNSSHLGGPYLAYHDGFVGLDPWHGVFNKTTYERVFLETHMYLIFDENVVHMTRDKQAQFPCGAWKKTLQKATRISGAPTLVGEFSAATNDCGKYVNGIGMGARYEGTLLNKTARPLPPPPDCKNCSCAALEDWPNWDEGYKAFLRSFVEHQMDAFETTSVGWFFWTYKTENHVNPHWDYLLAWEQGWSPRDANTRSYFCGDPASIVGDPAVAANNTH